MDERRIKNFFHGLRNTPLHPQWLVFRRDDSVRQWLADHASGRVLDIGCADARMRRFLSSSCEYVGFDYPTTALGWYGTRPDVFGDAARLPFSHGCFDAVMLLDVLEHLPDVVAALSEAYRVLRPDGRLIVKVPMLYPLHDAPLDYWRWTRFGLERELAEHGFVVLEVRGLGTPLETSVLLTNLAHAKCSVTSIQEKRFLGIILALALPPVTLLRNLWGWLTIRVSADTSLMPYSLCVIAARVGRNPEPGNR